MAVCEEGGAAPTGINLQSHLKLWRAGRCIPVEGRDLWHQVLWLAGLLWLIMLYLLDNAQSLKCWLLGSSPDSSATSGGLAGLGTSVWAGAQLVESVARRLGNSPAYPRCKW